MATEMEVLSPNDELSMTPITSVAMDAATRSEINMQVEFARQNPRSITAVLKELEELITLNQAIAEESFYTLKRKDKEGNVKLIQGPSIRFAEVLCYCWGHVRWQKQIADVDAEWVTGEGVFMDLQRNILGRVRTKRRITDKNNRRYNADMIQTTGNAASSVAYRNAVTGSVPQALWKDILEKAKVVAIGGTASIGEKRTKALEYGAKIGVSPESIFETLGVQGINDIGVDELIALRGLFNSLKDGETTIEEAFGDPHEKELDALFEKLGYNQGRRDNLRGNYRGRSLDLLTYLRKQAEPLGGEPAKEVKPEPTKTEAQTVASYDEANRPKTEETAAAPRKRGRPAKNTAAEPAKESVVAAETEHFKDGTFAPKDEEKVVETTEKPAVKQPEPKTENFNF